MNGDASRVPHHVGIIMDGNGRWAKQQGRSVNYGHRAGVRAIKRVMYACDDLGVKVLSIYAFSTENWSRSRREVGGLTGLFEETVRKGFDKADLEAAIAEYNRRERRFGGRGDGK